MKFIKMISLQAPLLSYIWFTILVCLATCNYDLANNVNPFDTNFFKIKRKNLKSFLPQLNPIQFGQPIGENSNNFTKSDNLAFSNLFDRGANFNFNDFSHNPNKLNIDIKGHQMETASRTTSESILFNNYHHDQSSYEIDTNLINRKAIEQYASESSEFNQNNPSVNHGYQLLPFEPSQSLKCEPKPFPQKVFNTDDQGRRCYDTIVPMGCSGRCDTGEFADWKFPYKKSFHRVCMHKMMRMKTVRLRNCDSGVSEELRIYSYLNAETCACQMCKSSEVSCEGLGYLAATAPYDKKSGRFLTLKTMKK